MRAPISVIIPALNAAAQIAPLAGQLYDGVMAGVICELILADGGSSDDTQELAEELGARLVQAPKGRGAQLVKGCAAAQGEWLLILHADSKLPPNWLEALQKARRNPQKAHFFCLRFDDESLQAKFVALWANFRAKYLGIPFGDQGLFIHQSLYQTVGGYRELPLMEDMDLARRLSGHLAQMDASLTTSARRYRRDGWLCRGGANLLRQVRFLLGVDAAHLARRYDQ